MRLWRVCPRLREHLFHRIDNRCDLRELRFRDCGETIHSDPTDAKKTQPRPREHRGFLRGSFWSSRTHNRMRAFMNPSGRFAVLLKASPSCASEKKFV